MKAVFFLQLGVSLATLSAQKVPTKDLKTFEDSQNLKPGEFRRITPADLPKPFATSSALNFGGQTARTEGMFPKAPAGFKVELYATGAKSPRKIITAPNGDFFVAESNGGNIKVYRGIGADGKYEKLETFASGLTRPYGLAFYPANNPQWLYVGNTDSVVRFAYKSGDMVASGKPEVLVNDLPKNGNHWTRDIVFSKDGKKMFVAVGSNSNVDDPDTHKSEFHRASVLEFTPEGKFTKVYASGIRNPAGLGMNPTTGEVWVSVNERDALGDNLVPDYVSSIKEDGFYGWPYYYMGSNPDPRLEGKHPELQSKTIVPDVLLQPHNASLGVTFYDGKMFPPEYQGDLFAAEHGSWNRAVRSGYEVVRVPLTNGKSSGVYEDFLTGFVNEQGEAWGRPVGVTVAKDGSMLVTDDGANVIWRVTYKESAGNGGRPAR
jgi:glucose/arabinose dehydrogenase